MVMGIPSNFTRSDLHEIIWSTNLESLEIHTGDGIDGRELVANSQRQDLMTSNLDYLKKLLVTLLKRHIHRITVKENEKTDWIKASP